MLAAWFSTQNIRQGLLLTCMEQRKNYGNKVEEVESGSGK